MPDIPPDLIDAFRRLGLPRAESWAGSEIREGINQLSRAKFLYWLFSTVTKTNNADDASISSTIGRYDRTEAKQAGAGTVYCPEAPIYKRMLEAGFTERDIRVAVRQAEVRILMDVCCVFDACGEPPAETQPCRFGVFELDDQGKPLRPVEALHESLHDFDQEVRERLAAAPPLPKPDWLRRLSELRQQNERGEGNTPAG